MAKVSICVPTYNNPEDVERLMESIWTQTYKDIEVVISDDSTDDRISELIDRYKSKVEYSSVIMYVHNKKPLGHIYNWNKAIKLSTGEYIKIMFSDDWFTFDDSLEKLVNMLDEHPEVNLAFSSSRQVMLDNADLEKIQHTSLVKKEYDRIIEDSYIDKLKNDYRYIFISNQIGAPSDTLYRRGEEVILFDEKSNWASDCFLYLSILSKNQKFVNTTEPLISIGIHEAQYTESFTDKDERVYQDYKYMYQKYDLQYSQECRKHMTEMYIVKWHKGPSEAQQLGIEMSLYWKMVVKEFSLAVKCYISSRVQKVLK